MGCISSTDAMSSRGKTSPMAASTVRRISPSPCRRMFGSSVNSPRLAASPSFMQRKEEADRKRERAEKNHAKFLENGAALNSIKCRRMLMERDILGVGVVNFHRSFEKAMFAIKKLHVVAELFIAVSEAASTDTESDESPISLVDIWNETRDTINNMMADAYCELSRGNRRESIDLPYVDAINYPEIFFNIVSDANSRDALSRLMDEMEANCEDIFAYVMIQLSNNIRVSVSA